MANVPNAGERRALRPLQNKVEVGGENKPPPEAKKRRLAGSEQKGRERGLQAEVPELNEH